MRSGIISLLRSLCSVYQAPTVCPGLCPMGTQQRTKGTESCCPAAGDPRGPDKQAALTWGTSAYRQNSERATESQEGTALSKRRTFQGEGTG